MSCLLKRTTPDPANHFSQGKKNYFSPKKAKFKENEKIAIFSNSQDIKIALTFKLS